MFVKKFLCPSCRKLTDVMIEERKEVIIYDVTVVNNDEKKDVEYEMSDCLGSKHLTTTCPECDYTTEQYYAENFIVEIDEQGKKVRSYGMYWDLHPEDLGKIMEKKGYKVVKR